MRPLTVNRFEGSGLCLSETSANDWKQMSGSQKTRLR
jgi:hypothetical protein